MIDEEFWARVFKRIGEGVSLRSVAEDHGVAYSTLHDRIHADDERKKRYLEALTSRAMHHAARIEELVELVESGTRIQQEARAGRADMLLLFSKKPDRMEYLNYPDESYIDISWSFFIRAEDAGTIRFEGYDDLKGLQIGITQDFAYTPEFLNAGLDFQTVASNNLQIGMLLAKRVDAVPMNTISTLYEEKKAGRLDQLATLPLPLITKPYYNVFAKASTYPDIESLPGRYDETIREMQSDGTLDAILIKYLGRRPGHDDRGGS